MEYKRKWVVEREDVRMKAEIKMKTEFLFKLLHSF